MFDETDDSSERLPCQIVQGHLAVVEAAVGDSPKALVNKPLDFSDLLSNCKRADLLMIATTTARFAR